MSNDSRVFEDAEADKLVRLYGSGYMNQFDHRWASYIEGKMVEMSERHKAQAGTLVATEYWVPEVEVDARLPDRWRHEWLMVWRDFARSSDARTCIAAVIPRSGVGHTAPILLVYDVAPRVKASLLANFNAFVLDYAARQKVSGRHVTFFILEQLPLFQPDVYEDQAPWQPDTILRDWIADRVLELSYTAWDLQPFAQDLGYDGPPFKWDVERRFEIRCELDAAYFHLYEIERDDVDYIMSTFPIVKRKDEAAHGTYRTRDRILEIYDAMASGQWESSLDPPVADPRAAHQAE